MSGVKKVNAVFDVSTEIDFAKENEVLVPVVKSTFSVEGGSTIVSNMSSLKEILSVWVDAKENSTGLQIDEKRDILAGIKSMEDMLKDLSSRVIKMQVTEATSVVATNQKVDAGVSVEQTKKKFVRKGEGVQKASLANLDGKSKSVGFFGVTANPPHIAHCEVIRHALKQCDEVWVSPVFMHPFGKKPINYEHRLALLELIIEDFFEDLSELRRIKIIEVDKEYVSKFETIPYSYDLLSYLRETLPNNRYSLVIGEDNHKPEVWQRFHKHKEIEAEFDLIIAPDLGVHSTQIRESFSDLTEDALETFCLPQATRYMKKHRFWNKN